MIINRSLDGPKGEKNYAPVKFSRFIYIFLQKNK